MKDNSLSSQPDITDYDKSGYDYTKYWKGRQYEHQIEARVLEKYLPPSGKNLVDIGGGFGRLTPIYQARFDKITILDYSQNLLDKAQQTAQENNWNNLETVQGDVYKMPFADNSFDCIVMIRVMHHIEDPAKAITEISRVLKPKGILVLEAANKIHLKAVLKALVKGNFGFRNDPKPIRHETVNINGEAGIFYNFHPNQIKQIINDCQLSLDRTISVSNLRIPVLKKIMSDNLLTKLDQILEPVFTKLNLGPSIWYICQSQKEKEL